MIGPVRDAAKRRDNLAMPVKPSIIVVDSNCFIRLLFSNLRPILGSIVRGYRLMTLLDLAAECGPGTEVVERYPWLLEASVQDELKANCLRLREPKASHMKTWADRMRLHGNRLLRDHCISHRMDKVRELSRADVNALAAAQVLNGGLATDEWPLTWAAERVSDVELVLTSIGLVHLMETDGKISRQERNATVCDWLKQGEALPFRWREQFQQLFGEPPPTAQP